MRESSNIVIIGAGHAGGSVASLLREQNHKGGITLIGSESVLPYQRPPLSKAFLCGETDTASLLLKNADIYSDQAITVRTDTRAISIDRARHEVLLSDNTSVSYDKLVIATGAQPRRLPLPGSELNRVYSLRSIEDALLIRAAAQEASSAVLIGGGYIGLETAASLSKLGLHVSVLEREPRLLARVASQPIADFLLHKHRNNKVRIVLDARIKRLLGDTQVSAVELEDGTRLDCDMVLIGAGVVPSDELAREAGLTCDNGIITELNGQTSDPDIYAIGDVSNHPLPHYEQRHMRVESVPNALEQARQLVAHLLGRLTPRHEAPWFWSDQYDAKLQIAGLPFDCDRFVVRGDIPSGKFSVFHLRNDCLRAAECMNSPADFIISRQLIENATTVDAEKLADTSIKLRDTRRT